MSLAILYQDDYLVAINKPSGLLVHRSPMDRHTKHFAVQQLAQQLGQKVYPVHRLDKPTSGILLFALHQETTRQISATWGKVEKTYWAVTRGKVRDCLIDHPITTKPDKGDTFSQAKIQSAQTQIKNLSSTSLNVGFGHQAKDYPNTEFSLVEAKPHTGRRHQIRKHLKHINHPIVGDTRYGRGEINRYFRTHHNLNQLLLHCCKMAFTHPSNGNNIVINCHPTWGNWLETLFNVG